MNPHAVFQHILANVANDYDSAAFALDTTALFSTFNLCEFLLYYCELTDFANAENLLKVITAPKM